MGCCEPPQLHQCSDAWQLILHRKPITGDYRTGSQAVARWASQPPEGPRQREC